MAQKEKKINWDVIAELPVEDKVISTGFAGMFAGELNGNLLMAGGAYFPEAMPWQGGRKVYNDRIYCLFQGAKNYIWKDPGISRLPEPIAYAAYATVKKSVVYAGGENHNGLSDKVWQITYDDKKNSPVLTSLNALPFSVTNGMMAAVGNKIFFAGGDKADGTTSNKFLILDFAALQKGWQNLPDLPLPVSTGVMVVQNYKGKKTIFLIGGRSKTTAGISTLHTTVFVYEIEKAKWKRLSDIHDGEKVTPFTASAGFAFESNSIVLAGGDKGDVFHRIEKYLSQSAQAKDTTEAERLIAEKNILVMHHQGFSTDVLVYDIKKDKWQRSGSLPVAAQVTAAGTIWKEKLIICSGEIRPGVRSPKIIAGSIK